MQPGSIHRRKTKEVLRVQVLSQRGSAVWIRILSPPTRPVHRVWIMDIGKLAVCFAEEKTTEAPPPCKLMSFSQLRRLRKDLCLEKET